MESTGMHGESPGPSAPGARGESPVPGRSLCLRGFIDGLLAPLFLVALAVVTATSAGAQAQVATTGNTDSRSDWTMTEEEGATGIRAAGVAYGPGPHAIPVPNTPGPRTASANTGAARPKITITADPRDTIYGSLEDMRFVLRRDSVGDSLTVKLWLQQDEDWLERRTQTRHVYFYPKDSTAVMKVSRSKFDPSVTRAGCIVAKVVEARGYDFGKARAPVWVISSPDPVMTLFVGRNVFTEAEDAGKLSGAHVVAYMAPDMPRGVSYTAMLDTRGKASNPELTATAGEDYELPRPWVVIEESGFKLYDDTWVGGGDFDLSILDDDLREGDQVFEVILEADRDLSEVVRYKKFIDGKTCDPECVHRVNITDDEPVPEMDLSVSEDEIMEEGETSSMAMVSIVDDVMFEADQLVTLALDGTATLGSDYAVSPADADEEMADYQVVLPGRSASTGVTLRAMSDDDVDPGEKIEVSAAHDGNDIGDMQAIGIMDQEVPAITLAADRDTIIGGMERLFLTATREEPLDESLTVTVELKQDRDWLSELSRELVFPADSAVATLLIQDNDFSTSVTESGSLTATVDSVGGYDTGDATVTVFVFSQEGPAMKVSFGQDGYRMEEDSEDSHVVMLAWAAAGMPRAAMVHLSVTARSGTAEPPDDYGAVSIGITVPEEDFAFENGLWRAQYRLPLSLVDDDVREGTESFDLLLERTPGHPHELQLSDILGAPCQDNCRTPVEITDEEDIPEFEFSVSEDEIMEDGETSSVATVSITNGKTFADDQVVTLILGGDAIPEHDYAVTPADADEEAADHQVTLTAGSSSVEVTLTARDDDLEEGDEKIRLAATHDGDAIGNETVRIMDRIPGPRVEITFEGVDPPDDDQDAGIARGPFTTRFTFSEEVEGFTVEDIDWQTHSGTTEDSTNIGVHLWDFTEVRAGLEYTVEMMATQKGRLWILVFPGKATSVATGDGNQLGANSLWIRFPKDRMLVAPTEFTVYEGDAEGAFFLVVLTSAPTDTVKVTVSGMAGTEVEVEPDTLTVVPRFWRVGRGMDVTAGSDSNTADETVTLTVRAWGGGYEGRSERVVVTVRDIGAAYAPGMSEEEALTLVDGTAPEAAAAALFGEGGLSGDQLEALDVLGNGNGDYDLGDLTSWIARCRRGEANCGVRPSAPESIPAVPAVAAGLGVRGQKPRSRCSRGSIHGFLGAARRSGGANRRRRRVAGGTRGPARNRRVRRRSGTAGYGLALLLAAAVTWWGCTDGVVGAPGGEADPGFLAVQLTVSSETRDIAAMLMVEGPGIDSVRAPGFELFQSDTHASTRRQVIISGALSTGTILEFRVPDRGEHARYRVRLLQVAGGDYLPRDLSDYTAMISRR